MELAAFELRSLSGLQWNALAIRACCPPRSTQDEKELRETCGVRTNLATGFHAHRVHVRGTGSVREFRTPRRSRVEFSDQPSSDGMKLEHSHKKTPSKEALPVARISTGVHSSRVSRLLQPCDPIL